LGAEPENLSTFRLIQTTSPHDHTHHRRNCRRIVHCLGRVRTNALQSRKARITVADTDTDADPGIEPDASAENGSQVRAISAEALADADAENDASVRSNAAEANTDATAKNDAGCQSTKNDVDPAETESNIRDNSSETGPNTCADSSQTNTDAGASSRH
jgi:hypothetical protein